MTCVQTCLPVGKLGGSRVKRDRGRGRSRDLTPPRIPACSRLIRATPRTHFLFLSGIDPIPNWTRSDGASCLLRTVNDHDPRWAGRPTRSNWTNWRSRVSTHGAADVGETPDRRHRHGILRLPTIAIESPTQRPSSRSARSERAPVGSNRGQSEGHPTGGIDGSA
jgi:hypothetical protein